MANFDEKSGVVPCKTEWGTWHQSMDEVVVMIDVAQGTSARDLTVKIAATSLEFKTKNGDTAFKGKLFASVLCDECTWTLEDKKLVRITLFKSTRTAAATWKSLLDGQYEANVADFDSMEKKMTLERMARENPGFDFSGADISGNYHGGGPDLTKS